MRSALFHLERNRNLTANSTRCSVRVFDRLLSPSLVFLLGVDDFIGLCTDAPLFSVLSSFTRLSAVSM